MLVKYRGAPFTHYSHNSHNSHYSHFMRRPHEPVRHDRLYKTCAALPVRYNSSQETVLSAIGGCSVEQGRVLRRVRCGSVPLYTTKPAQAQGSRLPAMRHRSLNNFHKKWDNNKSFKLSGRKKFLFSAVFIMQNSLYFLLKGVILSM